MTAGDYTLLFGLLANAAAVLWTARRHRSDMVGVKTQLDKVEHHTNGMVAQLEAVAKQAGIEQGRDEGRAGKENQP